jgi:hypothetical protein
MSTVAKARRVLSSVFIPLVLPKTLVVEISHITARIVALEQLPITATQNNTLSTIKEQLRRRTSKQYVTNKD